MTWAAWGLRTRGQGTLEGRCLDDAFGGALCRAHQSSRGGAGELWCLEASRSVRQAAGGTSPDAAVGPTRYVCAVGGAFRGSRVTLDSHSASAAGRALDGPAAGTSGRELGTRNRESVSRRRCGRARARIRRRTGAARRPAPGPDVRPPARVVCGVWEPYHIPSLYRTAVPVDRLTHRGTCCTWV